jgi:amino acid adenylation domain-containing protein
VISLLHDYVSRHARIHGGDVAAVMDDRSLTYAELDDKSDRLARWLGEAGCRPGDRVCLLAPKSLGSIIGIIAALKAGCAYVPLDAGGPLARTRKMVDAVEPVAILATERTGESLSDITTRSGWSPVTALVDHATDEEIRGEGEVWKEGSGAELRREIGVDDLAYIMFTSGSTGDPKGVTITHANVSHFVEWGTNRFRMQRGDRHSGHSPFHFDLSVFDLFGSFAVGAELHLVPPEKNLIASTLLDLIRSARLTQWFSVPTSLVQMATHADLDDVELPSLERLFWCGEVLPTPILRRWMRRFPDVEFTNLYGPTETTIASSAFTVAEPVLRDDADIPIGLPCDGEELLVLDQDLRQVPSGVVGELYVGGVGLSPGYWRDEVKTAAAFIPHPFRGDGDERLYRTGDLATVGVDGLVSFRGRADTQIKSRGYRIELGEIETAVGALGLLGEWAVVGVPSSGFEGTAICCAFAPRRGRDVPIHELRRTLGELLPSYMLPSRWRAFDELPKNANGKIDRPALKALFAQETP